MCAALAVVVGVTAGAPLGAAAAGAPHPVDGAAAAEAPPRKPAPRVLATLPGRAGPGARIGERILFPAPAKGAGLELWVTNGTARGTRLLKDIVPGTASSTPDHLVAFKGRVYFVADSARGNELWVSDGTARGTRVFADLSPSGSSFPNNLTVAGDRLFFTAGAPATGEELYVTSGSRVSTHLVQDLRPGRDNSLISGITAYGSQVVFNAQQLAGINKPWITNAAATRIERLDNLAAGVNLPSGEFTKLGARIIFQAGTSTTGPEVWRSEAMPGDARLVKELVPGVTGSFPTEFTRIDDFVVFAAQTPQAGRELWITNGDPLLTNLVKDINPGAASSAPTDLVGTGGAVYFGAADATHGYEIWRTFGTVLDTVLLKDTRPGSPSGLTPLELRPTLVGGWLLFNARNDNVGVEPWRSNGGAGGTRQLANLNPGPGDSTPVTIGRLGRTWLFDATRAGRHRIWAYTPERLPT